MAEFKWIIKEFLSEIDNAVEAGLDRGAFVIQERATINLSRPGTPSSKSGQAAFNRAERIFTGPRSGAFRRLQKAGRRTKEAARAVFQIRKLGGFIDPPGGMPRKRTGTLARSIVIDASEDRVRRIGPDKSVPYAAIHEFGGAIKNPGGQPYIVVFGKAVFVKKGSASASKPHTKFTKPSVTQMPARPYMRPSIDQTQAQVAKEFADSVEAVFTERGTA